MSGTEKSIKEVLDDIAKLSTERTCATCVYFKRGRWHKSIDPNESEQMGGHCPVLDKIMGMNNAVLTGSRLYIQESFGCVMHRECDKSHRTK